METKEFKTDDVLSTITGVLVGDIRGVYGVLNWMTGESVFTHQLSRIGREARPVVLAAHPQLAQAIEEVEQVNPDNWRQWRQTWEDRYGPTIAVPRFTKAEHEYIDPMSELVEKVHPDRIIVLGTD